MQFCRKCCPCRRDGGFGSDSGTILPLILLSFLLAILMVCGGIAASSAFLSQRDLSSRCDGAALAAAQGLNKGGYYKNVFAENRPVDGLAQSKVDAYLAANGPVDVDAVAHVKDGVVTVHCTTRANIPFAKMFGYPDGVPREITSSAESKDG